MLEIIKSCKIKKVIDLQKFATSEKISHACKRPANVFDGVASFLNNLEHLINSVVR